MTEIGVSVGSLARRFLQHNAKRSDIRYIGIDSVESMIKTTKRGLLVSRFWYIRSVDPRTITLTGLTRDGVWYIEDNAIKHPVRNFRFNQSITGLLAPGNVEMIGASERVGSSEEQGDDAMLLPALKVKRFSFTSLSEAV